MSEFVESIRLLYQEGFIDNEKVLDLYKNEKLTIEEVNFILDSDSDSNAL